MTSVLTSYSNHPHNTNFARSSTFPRPAAKLLLRLNGVDLQLPKSKAHIPGKPVKQERALHISRPDKLESTQTSQPAAMSSKRAADDKECPTCKRKYEDEPAEEKPPKLARKDTVDIDAEVEDALNQLPPYPSPPLKQHALFQHCVPPVAPVYRDYSVFLAGSIEMGKAVQWQQRMASYLSDLPITVNNPRRGHWDPNVSTESKDTEFRRQVEWELDALEKADVIAFFFDATTISPVTMMELGLWAKSKKVVVCCDKRFWRSGNIHLVCERYGVPHVESFLELVPAIKEMLGEKGMKLDENNDLIK